MIEILLHIQDLFLKADDLVEIILALFFAGLGIAIITVIIVFPILAVTENIIRAWKGKDPK